MMDVIDEFVAMGEAFQNGVVKSPVVHNISSAGTFYAGTIFSEVQDRGDASFTPLFRSKNLNRCTFMKSVTRATDAIHIAPNKVATKICLPYSEKNNGQDNLFLYYGEKNFQEKIERAFNTSMSESDKEFDFKTLDILDSIPTFDPFLLRDRFELEGRAISDAYTKVQDSDFEYIKKNIISDFEKIVKATMDVDSALDASVSSRGASKLFTALWFLDDLQFLLPLCKALGVKEGDEKEYFYSWKGILFYVYKYSSEFSSIGDNAVLAKRVALSDGRGDPEKITFQIQGILKEKETLDRFIANYNSAFDAAFVNKTQTTNFLRILKNAGQIFWTIGTVIGRLDLYSVQFNRTLSGRMSGRIAENMRDFLGHMQR